MGTRNDYTMKENSRKDHPHACGDKTTMFTAMEQDEGSSPRVWGQVELRLAEVEMLRIIPTRVGTRSSSRKNTAAP